MDNAKDTYNASSYEKDYCQSIEDGHDEEMQALDECCNYADEGDKKSKLISS